VFYPKRTHLSWPLGVPDSACGTPLQGLVHSHRSAPIDQNPTPTTTEAAPTGSVEIPTLGALFYGFLTVALSGFGGVLPWARRMLVEQRKWLTDREFTDTLGLCQFLPGPNIINVSIAVGQRFHGLIGSIVAASGLISAPLAIVLTLAILYENFGENPLVRGGLTGVSAAAAGLVVGMALKMTVTHLRSVRSVLFIAAGFTMVAILRVPLVWVLATLVPLSIVVAYAVGARRP
jgi:chromate transporter